MSQLNLLHGAKGKKSNDETKNNILNSYFLDIEAAEAACIRILHVM